MPITAGNPRRARLIVTLTGLAIAILGIILWGTGDIDRGVAEVSISNASSSTWGDITGFDSDQDGDMAIAQSDLDSAKTQMAFGIGLLILGLALTASRWRIQPAVTPKVAPAAATLTPEQQEQAIAMYLEAQKRTAEQ
ncbi:hypothetical protein ABZS61_34395 [Streptomyces sp. NPDC005566]|uniref:hypothetical protein n=1 Tax=Streptomyces sp. NPDC005566 TaxID=3156886 RepID=UPI0033A2113D